MKFHERLTLAFRILFARKKGCEVDMDIHLGGINGGEVKLSIRKDGLAYGRFIRVEKGKKV